MVTSAQGDDVLIGFTAIAKRLGVGSRSTVYAYTLLERDPLTLHQFRRSVWQRAAHVEEWRLRHRDGVKAELPRLVGVRAIASFIGRGATVAKVLAWSKQARDPLPLFTVRGGEVVAFESAVRDWCLREDRIYAAGEREGGEGEKSAGDLVEIAPSIRASLGADGGTITPSAPRPSAAPPGPFEDTPASAG